MTRDPRIFRPEEEIQRQINAVNAGFINPDGTRADGDQGAPIGGGIGFKFTMVLLPFITVFLAAVVWIGGIAGCAPSLRALLTAALPQSWVATSAGAPNNPAGVGAVLAIVLLFAAVGLLVARRLVVRRWVSAGGLHAFGAALGVFGLSAVLVLLLILTPGVLLVGISIATGADLEAAALPDGATVRAWPLILTAAAAAWFALGATRRLARRRWAARQPLVVEQYELPPWHGAPPPYPPTQYPTQ